MTGRTCAIIALLSAAGGGTLVAFVRDAPPARKTRPAAVRPSAPLEAPFTGRLVFVRLGHEERDESLNRRLCFCVFENGDNDLIYASTKYGMWAQGEFDLSIEGNVVFTGEIEYLLYEGILINMGDVLAELPRSNFRINITRVTGVFK